MLTIRIIPQLIIFVFWEWNENEWRIYCEWYEPTGEVKAVTRHFEFEYAWEKLLETAKTFGFIK